jgi:hypothetical protein
VANPTSLEADGAGTSTITVQLKDANGNNLAASGGTVALSTTAGTLSAVTDKGDGSYTATLTVPTAASTATSRPVSSCSATAASATRAAAATMSIHVESRCTKDMFLTSRDDRSGERCSREMAQMPVQEPQTGYSGDAPTEDHPPRL